MIEPRLIAPLGKFYDRSGLILPEIEIIPGEAMPEPRCSLLVHTRDMTSTLERFHGARCHIRTLQWLEDEAYSRLVVLELDGSGKPVEFGAITIHLEAFREHARELILERRLPLGTILNEEHIGFVSCPQAFFCVTADDLVAEALKVPPATQLYARSNRLSTSDGQALAEIVEILP